MPSLRTPPSGLGISTRFTGCGSIGPAQQLFPNGWPVLFQVVGELIDGHAVHSRTTFVGLDPSHCFLQVFSLTYRLHQSIRASWVFGFIRRPERFSLFSGRAFGLHPSAPDGKSSCIWMILLLVVIEIRVLLAAPSRSGLLRCRILCPLLTSALRSGCLAATSVAAATRDRSPEVSSAAFRAQSPDLRFACLMDMDFAVSCPLVPRSRLISGFCPSTRVFAPRFLQTPPRGDSPCVSLTLHLHQVG